ncbi:MAG TPA: maleylpyruvate isomerase family mycothiol-dependent enzyme [Longimicrobiales bacterium]|nr:maleylpyruvate isomerase family mycothiol-dependent enzyme [Longimicrobiales bacterium]
MADRFGPLHAELMALLRRLQPDDWGRPTSAGNWRVRDVVAHLLDGDLRRLSIARDGHFVPPGRPIEEYDDLVGYLDDLNADWLRALDRVSPTLLVDLLGYVGPQLAAFMATLDPSDTAPLGVAWAGQERSPNWLDAGREYTERWHHQDQVREAVGAEPLADDRWLRPVLEISLRALPHAYRDVRPEAGARSAVVIETTGAGAGRWSLVREGDRWALYDGAPADPACRVALPGLVAARLLLHRLPAEEVREHVAIEGEERLARPFLEARAVMV